MTHTVNIWKRVLQQLIVGILCFHACNAKRCNKNTYSQHGCETRQLLSQLLGMVPENSKYITIGLVELTKPSERDNPTGRTQWVSLVPISLIATQLQSCKDRTNLVWRKALAKQPGRFCVSVLRYPSAGKVGINLWFPSFKTVVSLICKPG